VKFDVKDIFKANDIANELLSLDKPAILREVPEAFYERIRSIAQKRYSFALPA
jgi:hypothetical protein